MASSRARNGGVIPSVPEFEDRGRGEKIAYLSGFMEFSESEMEIVYSRWTEALERMEELHPELAGSRVRAILDMLDILTGAERQVILNRYMSS